MIDSHHHLWNYNADEFGWIDHDVIRRSFRAPELDTLLSTAGISGAIAVQARCCLEENDFLLSEAATSALIKGVVGWVDLKSTATGSQLDHYSQNPLFKGVREITQGATDADFFTHPAFNAGIGEITQRDLTYDILIVQSQIKAATEFVDAHPNQRFVLDHAAKPEIRADSFPTLWEKEIRELAKRESLVCKLSGLVTEVRDPSWDNQLMRRYFDVLLDCFGPSRLMFGSDWPVCLIASEYTRLKDSVLQIVSSLSADEQKAIFSGTATHFYSL